MRGERAGEDEEEEQIEKKGNGGSGSDSRRHLWGSRIGGRELYVHLISVKVGRGNLVVASEVSDQVLNVCDLESETTRLVWFHEFLFCCKLIFICEYFNHIFT